MTAECYVFNVGNIECAVILDGATVIGRAGILKRFPDATEADYEQAYADIGQSLNDAVSSMNIFVARIGEEIVLVDSGEGGKPKGGYLPEGLRLAGIEPESITLVALTHTHGDHVLGLLSDDNQPVFPNATYVISEREMAFWQNRIDNGIVAQHSIITMMREKGVRLIEMDEEILPGLTALPIPGHTPGMIALLLESENEKLIHLADLLHSPMQFAHPEWSPSFDADTSVSVPTRRAALQRTADENLLALFYHLIFPGLGRVERAENGFIWQPLETS